MLGSQNLKGFQAIIGHMLLQNCGFDIVMFGHTHRPMIDFGKNLITLNPGSLSYPRQEGRRPSYIMMELEGDLPARFRLEYL